MEARRIDAFDVVQVQLADQRDVESDLFAANSQIADVRPRRFHSLVFDVAQPSGEHGQPISESHATALRTIRSSSASTSFTVGSKPSTCTGSATQFASALRS